MLKEEHSSEGKRRQVSLYFHAKNKTKKYITAVLHTRRALSIVIYQGTRIEELEHICILLFCFSLSFFIVFFVLILCMRSDRAIEHTYHRKLVKSYWYVFLCSTDL